MIFMTLPGVVMLMLMFNVLCVLRMRKQTKWWQANANGMKNAANDDGDGVGDDEWQKVLPCVWSLFVSTLMEFSTCTKSHWILTPTNHCSSSSRHIGLAKQYLLWFEAIWDKPVLHKNTHANRKQPRSCFSIFFPSLCAVYMCVCWLASTFTAKQHAS